MAGSKIFTEYLHFSTHEDLIQPYLFGDLKDHFNGFIFRGVGLEEYALIPSVLRKETQKELLIRVFGKNTGTRYFQKYTELESLQQTLEFCMLFEFYSLCDLQGLNVPSCRLFNKTNRELSSKILFSDEKTLPLNWLPEDTWELAALAQHYGIPTRLLDWTRDLFTALFFAAISGLKEKNYGQGKYVTIWALNLSYIDYLNATNKTFPLKSFVPSYFSNPNLQAQSGVLTLWSPTNNEKDAKLTVDRRPLNQQLGEYIETKDHEPYRSKFFFYKITLPHSELKSLIKLLDTLNYTESRNFPGYNGAAMRVLNQHYRK